MKFYKIGICPHDIEGRIFLWEKFVKALSELSGLPLVLEEIKDFVEEEKKLASEEFLLYYSSPHFFPFLSQKGYQPLACFKDQRDYLVFIGVKPLKEILEKPFIKIALMNRAFFFLALYDFSQKKQKDFFNFQFFFHNSYAEILKKVVLEEVDLGIVCKDWYFSKGREQFEEIKIYEEFSIGTRHIFMFNPKFNLKEKLQMAFLSLERNILEELGYKEIELLPESERESLKTLELFNSFIYELFKKHYIAFTLLNSPYLGVMVYRERYIYVNSYALKLFGYSEEEFLKLKPEEIFYFEEDKEKARPIIEKRLKGEIFFKVYEETVLKTKEGKKFYAIGYSNTIFSEGVPCGLVVLIDVTKKKKLERIYQILKITNRILLETHLEEELFKKLGEALIEVFGIKMVWIGIPDYREKVIKPLFSFGREGESYLKTIKISMKEDEPEGKGPVGTAFRENKITIISDVFSDPRFNLWKEEALKRGYYSIAAIPLSPEKEVSYVLALYADEPEFFEEEERELLEELKRDLEFGLKRIADLRLQLLLAESLKKFREFLLILDDRFRILFTNQRTCEFLGFSLKDLIGKPLEIINFLVEDRTLEEFLKTRSFKEAKKIPVKWISYEGREVWLEFEIIPVRFSDKKTFYLLSGDYIYTTLEFYKDLRKAQFYDSLTGILNYQGFIRTLTEKLSEVEKGVLILIDIYNFSYLNTEYGYEYGDICLKEIANHFYKEFAIFSRISSDNFALFIAVKDEEEVKNIIKWLKKKMLEPLWIPVRTGWLTLFYHVGVARFPEDGKDFETLWKNANLALSKAKKQDPNTIEFFSSEYAKEISLYLKKEELVKKALKEKFFIFYYQPYFDLSNLKIVGIEALVRIREPDGTLRMPLEFVDILERCPYLTDFLKWSFIEIKKKILKWKLPISLNLPLSALKIEENLIEIMNLAKFLKEKEISGLEVEITERIFLENPELIKKIIFKFKELGIKVFLDDFGTGYSSLMYLKELPLDVIKIDRIFIKDLLKGKKEMGLVKTMIDLAHTLGMKVLAEGVEEKEQLRILDIMGCDYAQGFYLSMPMSERELEKFFEIKGFKK